MLKWVTSILRGDRVSAEPANNQDQMIGRTVQGRFQIIERLAAGGMGVVYKAVQQPLGRPVAFKILETQQSPGFEENFAQRFFLEASAAAKLAHPNTIVVHDYGKTDDGLFFIAMEYLSGGTLGRRLRKEGPLSPMEAIHVGLQVVSSLRDAHGQGLVHRDLKPGNIMFAPRGGDPMFVKVLDFGLVKMVGEQDMNLTRSGMMMGSPRYMAPEQVMAKAVDARTDIYSFGAVLYHTITGKTPFSAENAFEAMNHHVHTAVRPFREAWAGCTAGPQLEAVVMKCMAKAPEHRYQTMDRVFRALQACHGEAGGSMVGAGSYLAASSSDRSAPNIAPPSMGGSTPSGVVPAPAVPAPGATPPTYVRTAKWEPGTMPPPPDASSSGITGMEVEPAQRGLGALAKVALAGLVLLLAAGAAAAAALFIPLDGLFGSEPSTTTVGAEPDETDDPPDEVEPSDGTPTSGDEGTADGTGVTASMDRAEPVADTTPTTLLRTDPAGAAVRRDGADLGDSPLPLRIPHGERWEIEVSLDGYETRRVVVAGGQEQMLLHLRPRPTRARPRSRARIVPQVRPLGPTTPTHRPIRRPRNDGTGLDDPWGDTAAN